MGEAIRVFSMIWLLPVAKRITLSIEGLHPSGGICLYCQPSSEIPPFSQVEMSPFGHQVAGEGVICRFQGWSGADL